MSRSPVTKVLKRLRVDFAKKYFTTEVKWKLSFSTRKKFNLVGLHGFLYFGMICVEKKEIFSNLAQFFQKRWRKWLSRKVSQLEELLQISCADFESCVDIFDDNVLPEAQLITSETISSCRLMPFLCEFYWKTFYSCSHFLQCCTEFKNRATM